MFTQYQECSVSVLGGLPLTARYLVCKAEPDVGYFSDYFDDVHLVDRKGRKADWAERRMSDADWADVHDQLEM